MRLRVYACVLLLLVAKPPSARGDASQPRFGGKSIQEWIAQANEKSERRAEDAIKKLRDARFIVGAAELAVPALAKRITPTITYMLWLWIAEALRAYGPMARGASSSFALDESSKQFDMELVVTRIAIGIDPASDLDRLRAYLSKEASSLAFNPTLSGHIERLGRLGLRAEPVARQGVLYFRHTTGPDLARFASDAGPAALALYSELLELQDTERVDKFTRQYVAHALSWVPGLHPDRLSRVLSTTRAFPSDFSSGPILRALAWSVREPVPEVVALFRARSSASDSHIAALAHVGLARWAPDPKAQLPALQKFLKHESGDVRSAAAEALRQLAPTSPAALTLLRDRLFDDDLRVRWRAAASLLTAGGQAETALPEFLRGVEGPDDMERVAALGAISDVPGFAPLGPRLSVWSECPFPLIAAAARTALTRIKLGQIGGEAKPDDVR